LEEVMHLHKEAAERIERMKPITTVKVGNSEQGTAEENYHNSCKSGAADRN
jgi:hypothetical protein